MRRINVSIVYASSSQQWVKEFSVLRGTSAEELIEKSNFLRDIECLKDSDHKKLTIGIYAQKVEPDHLLEEGDRVEIYRPLTADPKEVRRQLALLGKTMGKK
jgi:putative ubiquitin-RnfH superfamily antitoxin RatB of RatAB toxin-antitoxin module